MNMQKNYNDNYDANFSDLKGKIITQVHGKAGDDTMRFETSDGETFQMTHYRDCCESVRVEDICGDLNDLIGCPILMAEEVESSDVNPEGVEVPEWQDSFTWTFYKLATIKGSVTIRWYGESNGYYSERVTFERVA